MKLKYAITAIVVVCAVILGAITAMGPKMHLQTPPIEAKAMDYLNKHNFLDAGEVLQGYKATSYYTYNSGIVITNKRIFSYYKDKATSIPLDKITLVVIKDSELGNRDILISAQTSGVIGFELYHNDAAKLLDLLHVPAAKVKFYTKQGDQVRNELPANMLAK